MPDAPGAPPGAPQEPSAPNKSDARRMWEEDGWSARVIGEHCGVAHTTVNRWAKKEGWKRPLGEVNRHRVPTDEELEEAAKRAEKAAAAQRLRWANRRAEVADEAGMAASEFLAVALDAAKGGEGRKPDPALAKAATISFAICVDKAQLLTGEVTGRVEMNTGEPTATDPQKMFDAGKERAMRLVKGGES